MPNFDDKVLLEHTHTRCTFSENQLSVNLNYILKKVRHDKTNGSLHSLVLVHEKQLL